MGGVFRAYPGGGTLPEYEVIADKAVLIDLDLMMRSLMKWRETPPDVYVTRIFFIFKEDTPLGQDLKDDGMEENVYLLFDDPDHPQIELEILKAHRWNISFLIEPRPGDARLRQHRGLPIHGDRQCVLGGFTCEHPRWYGLPGTAGTDITKGEQKAACIGIADWVSSIEASKNKNRQAHEIAEEYLKLFCPEVTVFGMSLPWLPGAPREEFF